MTQPAHGLKVLLTSTARYPFVQDDIDLLRQHFNLEVYIGSGFRGAWEHFKRAACSDVSISWFGSVYTFFMVLGARLRGRRSIVILGGADVANRPDLGYGIWRSRWKGMLLGYALRRADHVFAVDPALRFVLEKSSGRTWEKIVVLPTGYDAAHWTPAGAKQPVVLSVARCDTREKAVVKGIDRMIDMARALPHVRFRVIGIGSPAREHFAADAPANVELLPPVPREELLAEYRAAKVYCQLSRSEGLPNALCEAMLCGCVPVGTRVGGIPTAIDACGYVVDEEEGIAAMAAAVQRALEAPYTVGDAARAHIAANFTRERRERELVGAINESGGPRVRRLTTDAGLVFAADAGARLLGFIASAHLARTLGTDGFGVIVVGLAFLSYVLWFVDFGLATLGTREISRPLSERRWAPHEILRTRLLLALVIPVPAFVLAMVIYPPGSVRTVLLCMLANTVPYALTLEWYYQGIRRYGPLMISRTLTAALYLGMLLFLVLSPADLIRVPWFYALANLIPALLLFLFVRPGDSLAPRGFSWERTVQLLRRSGMIGVGGVFAQTVQLLPPLVLGYYSASDAGLLGAALRIIAVVLIVDRVFSVLFLPAVAGRLAGDAGSAAPGLERVMRLVIAVGFGMVALIGSFAPAIMTVVFGESYRAGSPVLSVLAWFAAVTLVNSVFTYGLIGAGREREYLRATMIGGIVTTAITLASVHLFGLIGAAVAMTASEVCVLALTHMQFRRVVRLRFMSPLVTAAGVAGAVVALAVWSGMGVRPLDLLWGAPAILLVFSCALLLLGAVRRDDILWVLRR